MTITNHQFKLAARPVGPVKASDWLATEENMREIGEGEILIKVLFASRDCV